MNHVTIQAFAEQFTPAERRVLERLMFGEVYKEIAAHLGCSRKTVEFHVYNMLRKSKLSSRVRLVALAALGPQLESAAARDLGIIPVTERGTAA